MELAEQRLRAKAAAKRPQWLEAEPLKCTTPTPGSSASSNAISASRCMMQIGRTQLELTGYSANPKVRAPSQAASSTTVTRETSA
jgi:hypothetical protein